MHSIRSISLWWHHDKMCSGLMVPCMLALGEILWVADTCEYSWWAKIYVKRFPVALLAGNFPARFGLDKKFSRWKVLSDTQNQKSDLQRPSFGQRVRSSSRLWKFHVLKRNPKWQRLSSVANFSAKFISARWHCVGFTLWWRLLPLSGERVPVSDCDNSLVWTLRLSCFSQDDFDLRWRCTDHCWRSDGWWGSPILDSQSRCSHEMLGLLSWLRGKFQWGQDVSVRGNQAQHREGFAAISLIRCWWRSRSQSSKSPQVIVD